MGILMKSLTGARKVFGFIIKTSLLILLVLITCTCSGPKSTLDNQTLGNRTDYSIYSGKPARPIIDVMACATLRIDDLDSLLWLPVRQLTKQQYLQIRALEYCPSLDLTRKKCLQIKLSQYQLTTRSSSSRYRMEWTAQKPSSPTGSRLLNLQEESLSQMQRQKKSQGLIPQSTGKIREITRMTGKN